jgi:DNA polymerase
MPWSERQANLLRGMGLRLWTPLPAATPAPATTAAPSPLAAPATSAARVRNAAEPSRPPPAARADAPPAAVSSPAGGSDLGTLDWPALRQAVVDCRACGLWAGRKQTVFGVGHPQAHWMVVGEAPGEQEDLRGEPFVGAAGQLLDRMLAALGLTRAEDGPQPPEQRVYIANTLKCRPPRNRNPAADEMARCEPFLVRQIELLKPRLILAMGRFAVQALLRSDEPIGRLRGRVHSYQGVPLVVTYHPAYLLRNLPDKAKAWEDLCLAASVVAAAEVP